MNPGDLITSSSTVYQLQCLLGSGVYGDVSLCRNLSTNQTVALKVMKGEDAVEAGVQEATILQALAAHGSENFHIVSWLGSFGWSAYYCHEFEKLDISLAEFLARNPYGSLRVNEIRPIIYQMAAALKFLKHVGIMHCDLKPQNIMMIDHVKQPLRIKVIDFGIACSVRDASQEDERQTLWYRAPECLLRAPVHGAIDMWSVGCIAAEMFLGAALFPARDEQDMMKLTVETVGHPPKSCLDQGLQTTQFYSRSQPTDEWRYELSPLDPTRQVTQLDHIYKRDPHGPLTSNLTENHDRVVFVHLLKRMLDLDPETRICPEEVLQHPFITISHLRGGKPDYLVQSQKLLYNASQSGQPQTSAPSVPPSEVSPTKAGLQVPKEVKKRPRNASVNSTPKRSRSSSPETSQKAHTHQDHKACQRRQVRQRRQPHQRRQGHQAPQSPQAYQAPQSNRPPHGHHAPQAPQGTPFPKKVRKRPRDTSVSSTPKRSRISSPETSPKTHQGHQACQCRQVHQHHQVLQCHHVHQLCQARQAYQAPQSNQAPQSHHAPQAPQGTPFPQKVRKRPRETSVTSTPKRSRSSSPETSPKTHQGHQACQCRQVLQNHHAHQLCQARQGHQAPQAPQAYQAPQSNQPPQGYRAHQALQGTPFPKKVRKRPRDTSVSSTPKRSRWSSPDTSPKTHQGHQACQRRQVHQRHNTHLLCQAPQGHQAPQAPQSQQALQGHQVPHAKQFFQTPQSHQIPKELRKRPRDTSMSPKRKRSLQASPPQGHQVSKSHQVSQANQSLQAPQGHLERSLHTCLASLQACLARLATQRHQGRCQTPQDYQDPQAPPLTQGRQAEKVQEVPKAQYLIVLPSPKRTRGEGKN